MIANTNTLKNNNNLCACILMFLILIKSNGQTIPPTYSVLTKKADSLFSALNYTSSAITYSQAFNTLGGKGLQEDRYKAARSWALAGFPDSALFNLERIAYKTRFADYTRVIKDTSLKSLYIHAGWSHIISKIKANQDSALAAEALMDKKLVALLDSMASEDQKWRKSSTIKKISNGEIPKDSVKWTDALNYPLLRRIFFSYGFPNYDIAGGKGSHNFWLLVQHQDMHPSFQDSVLSAMKIEVEKGKASWKDYAYLIDRVKCNAGQLQIYGTQVNWVSGKNLPEPRPVVEPEKLNERRRGVGLDTEKNTFIL